MRRPLVAQRLFCRRGEVLLMSSNLTVLRRDTPAAFVLLKHKDAKGQPVTTLKEIHSIPGETAPYRGYSVSYRDADGGTKSVEDCTTGLSLVMDTNTVARRSIVNLRERALERPDYDKWVADHVAGGGEAVVCCCVFDSNPALLVQNRTIRVQRPTSRPLSSESIRRAKQCVKAKRSSFRPSE